MADFEADFWGPAVANTWAEEWKQLKYMELMGFARTPTWRTQYSFDMGGRSVIDIGGGPCSILLKCENRGASAVVDPGEWPEWVWGRYSAADIQFLNASGESFPSYDSAPRIVGGFDLALIYNCLQHCEQPELVIANARTVAKTLCMFEWLDIPGHPHELKADLLNKWAGREGHIVELKGESECFGRAWVLGAPPPPPVPGARKSRIVLG